MRATYAGSTPEVGPKTIGIEYPEDEENWPAMFVQFRVGGDVTWTGLNPDEYEYNTPEGNFTLLRRGSFTGAFDVTILALSSEERDRLWDGLVQTILMGNLRNDTNVFYTSLANNDLIAMDPLPVVYHSRGRHSRSRLTVEP